MTSTTLQKDIDKLVIKELKDYRALQVQLVNRKEQEKEGIKNLFQTIRKSLQEKEYKNKENNIKVKQMERALNLLDNIERQIIEMKFLGPCKHTDMFIYEELGLTKTMYYEKKKEAMSQLARALGIE